MKKALSILLSLIMAFSAFSVMPFSAKALSSGQTCPDCGSGILIVIAFNSTQHALSCSNTHCAHAASTGYFWEDHHGGNACTEKPVCEVCGQEYGSASGHSWKTEWSYDGTTHWHACDNCTAKKDEAAHSFEATARYCLNGCGAENPNYTGTPASTLTTGDTFEMGMYPQTRVTDNATITALGAIPCTMTSYGYLKKTTETVNMTYADIEYNGAVYRKVRIDEYRPLKIDEVPGKSNTMQDNHGYTEGNTYYFKWDPIVWQVLGKDSSGVVVLSKSGIDAQAFNNATGETNWEDCSMRQWLNNDFYRVAFSSSEKSKIKTAANNNGDDVPQTQDNVWLLSMDEARNTDYGFINSTGSNPARYCYPTEYAKSQGLWLDNAGHNSWWMRTIRSSDKKYVQYVMFDSHISNHLALYADTGVRPAFKLDLDSAVGIADAVDCRVTGKHTYGNWEPDDGTNHKKVCTACGDVVTEIHSWNTEWSKDDEKHWHECTDCGAKKDEAEHSYGDVSYTWTKAGNNWKVTASRTCATCNKAQSEIVTATGVPSQAPTCTDMGETIYTATFVNPAFTTQTKTVEDIPALNHDWKTEWSKDAEHHWHDCTRCSEVNDKAEHNYAAPTYEWDGTSSVTAERKCNDCGWTETETKATTSEQTKPETCTEKGETTYTVTFDNPAFATEPKTVADVDSLGHDWATEWSKDATDHWHDCTRCSEVNDKAAHNYAAPTYTWDGTASVTAERVCDCGWTETETKAATSEQTKPETCTEKGETTYTVTFENPAFETQSMTVADVPALGHDYSKAVTDPTCTEQGYTTYTCSRGDDEYKDDYVNALGHTMTHYPAKAPTSTEDGNIEYWVCGVCGKYYADENGNTEITDPASVVLPAVPVYSFVGDKVTYTKDSNKPAEFTVKRSLDDEITFDNFTGIEIDGKKVDSDSYDASKGSVNISLKPSYLNTLSVGEHTLKVNFTDGEAETKFNVAAAQKADETGTDTKRDNSMISPATGNETAWLETAVMTAGFGLLYLALRKKERNRQKS